MTKSGQAGRPGIKRRNHIVGQFAARTIEMLESPAYRALSLSAHRLLSRLEIELAHHGGADNGKLPCTYVHFAEYGVHPAAIAPAIRECIALGFLRITREGRAGTGGYGQPHLFYLTYRNTAIDDATNEWRQIKTRHEAEAVADAARNVGKCSGSHTSETGSEFTPGKRGTGKAKFTAGKRGTGPTSENEVPLYLGGVTEPRQVSE